MPTGSDSGKWLECNGQSVDSATYPKLAALMSNVPNYQGVFLRGYGSQPYTDGYGTVNHISNNLGQIQDDAIRNITGTMAVDSASHFNGGYTYFTGPFNENPVSGVINEIGVSAGAGGAGWLVTFDTSRSVPTANENRPINMAVRYLIKAK